MEMPNSIGRHSNIMPQKLMDVLMLGRCSHEFSWPRRTASGDYYQVCLLCATAYSMTGRPCVAEIRSNIRQPRPPQSDAVPVRRKPTWMPRARRLKLSLPIRYRGKNLSTWYEGTVLNTSASPA